MTKQSIVSILEIISDGYRVIGDNIIFEMNDNSYNIFVISIKNYGNIYCNGIRTDNTNYLDFLNDGKMIAFFDYSAIEKIKLL